MVHHRRQGAGQGFLNRRNAVSLERRLAFVAFQSGLYLPPVITRAAIGDGELVALHGHGGLAARVEGAELIPDAMHYGLPVARRALTEQPHAGIPWAVLTIEHPPPVRRKG